MRGATPFEDVSIGNWCARSQEFKCGVVRTACILHKVNQWGSERKATSASKAIFNVRWRADGISFITHSSWIYLSFSCDRPRLFLFYCHNKIKRICSLAFTHLHCITMMPFPVFCWDFSISVTSSRISWGSGGEFGWFQPVNCRCCMVNVFFGGCE